MTNADRSVTLDVAGMTCEACEHHVADALQAAGARHVVADFRRGRAQFTLPSAVSETDLRAAVQRAGYQPGELRTAETRPATVTAGPGGVDYDLLVLGAGSAAFAAAIKAREAGARVALVEAGSSAAPA